MFQLDNVSKVYGDRTLFSELSWQLLPGRRIGLIGPNGAGKSTLFRMLCEEVTPDEGRLIRPKSMTIGHLPQEVAEVGEGTAIEVVMEGRKDLVDMEARIGELSVELAQLATDGKDIDAVADRLGDLQGQFEVQGGYALRATGERILAGMGFAESQFDKEAITLSGGMRVRLLLAQLLLQRPDVLLMDEPTNHLDVPSVEWLEGFLQDYEGTVVVISHDRYFLNKLATETAALDIDGFHITPGGFDAYQAARAERMDLLEKHADQQDRRLKQTKEFIDRFRSKASKAKQVQSRIKQLDKEVIIGRLSERKSISFSFPHAGRCGKVALTVDNVHKAYGKNVVYRGIDLEVRRGEKVGIVGPNGAGKSTLLKIIAEQTPADQGTAELGHNVVLGYFAQHAVDALDVNCTLLQEMESYATVDTAPLCRSILGAFLFSGDDAHKYISVLSGGERNRAAMAKLLLRPSNMLLLDEPTNHLDIESRNILIDAMAKYPGTILFVSHDRHFINAVASRVVHVEDGLLTNYAGDYEYYRFKRAQEETERLAAEAATPAPKPAASTKAEVSTASTDSGLSKKDRRRREAEYRKALARDTGKEQKALDTIESGIAALERDIAGIEKQLADPTLYADDRKADARKLSEDLGAKQRDLERLYYDWSPAAERLEVVVRRVRARYEDVADS